jgi:hypothetical protein
MHKKKFVGKPFPPPPPPTHTQKEKKKKCKWVEVDHYKADNVTRKQG